jgi:hypothetical protein
MMKLYLTLISCFCFLDLELMVNVWEQKHKNEILPH